MPEKWIFFRGAGASRGSEKNRVAIRDDMCWCRDEHVLHRGDSEAKCVDPQSAFEQSFDKSLWHQRVL
ncbi:MAG TPA: hypothetical protein DCM07_12330 [Planctomycetaceae bacterium]|nr:hypothetical protein [Gimesia sp.]HAH45618.1 hypothetical protein [Planctomycetaceae bacterium]HBL43808.1 hypothetical protein [Planctomycetaceae bacterium]